MPDDEPMKVHEIQIAEGNKLWIGGLLAVEKFNGRYAEVGEFPYIVYISEEIDCIGTLLSMERVVTAASCFKIEKEGKLVDVDTRGSVVSAGTRMHTSSRNAVRKIKKLMVHKNFKYGARVNGSLDNHNIGIIVLVKPFTPNTYIQSMKVVSNKKDIFIKEWQAFISKSLSCYSIGWTPSLLHQNYTKDDIFGDHDILRVYNVRVLPDDMCATYYPAGENFTAYGEICVDSITQVDVLCDGEQGSPLVCDGYPYALLSSSPTCNETEHPHIYVLYWYYLDFLDINLACRVLTTKWLTFSLSFSFLK